MKLAIMLVVSILFIGACVYLGDKLSKGIDDFFNELD